MNTKFRRLRLAAAMAFACVCGAVHADDFQLAWSPVLQNVDDSVASVSGYVIYSGFTEETMTAIWFVPFSSPLLFLPYPAQGTGPRYIAVTALGVDGLESAKSPVLVVYPE